MARKAQQAQAEQQEDERTPLGAALAADPWDRTEEQARLILQADRKGGDGHSRTC